MNQLRIKMYTNIQLKHILSTKNILIFILVKNYFVKKRSRVKKINLFSRKEMYEKTIKNKMIEKSLYILFATSFIFLYLIQFVYVRLLIFLFCFNVK